MFGTILNSWALFSGFGLIMIAHTLQGTLLNINSVFFNFSDFEIGYVFTGYFIGFLFSSIQCPKLIKNVGHIRVFAAFASLASLIILVHSILIHPFIWFLLRLLTGVSMVCMYTVAESWLNDRSSNKNRGSVLSIYMVILYSSMGIGMFFFLAK